MDMLITVLLEAKQQTFSPQWGITAPTPSGLSSPGNFATPCSATLQGHPEPRSARRASQPPPPRQVSGAAQAPAKPEGYGWRERGQRGRIEVLPKPELAAARPRCPQTPAPPRGQFGPARKGWRREGADSPEPPGPRPRGAQHVCAYPRRVCQRQGVRRVGKGGGGGSRNFPTCLLTIPITLSSSRDPLFSTPPQLALPRTRGDPRRRQGGGSYLPGKFPAPRCDSPPPGPGLGARPARRSAAASPPASEAAAAPAAATEKPAIRPVPPPRTAHTGASLAARIPALARVPEGTFLSRARPGRAPAPLPAEGCSGSRDPLGRGARTFRGAWARRLSAPALPAGSPAFPCGASPSRLTLCPSGTGLRWVIVFFSVSLKPVK